MKNLYLCIATILLIFSQSCDSKMKTRHVEANTLTNIDVSSSLNESEVILNKEQKDNTERKLTRDVNISFQTKDFKNICQGIRNIISKYHGLINNESSNVRDDNGLEAVFYFRIPAQSFELFMNELESVNGKIVNKEIIIKDITADYIDTETRLKTKKELEARYTQLLAKATKIPDMIAIEAELGKQREDIESMEGKFKFMQHEVANNLFHITINEPNKVTTGFLGKTLKALSNGWTGFVQFLIIILTLWPFIIMGFVFWFLIRKYLSGRKKIS